MIFCSHTQQHRTVSQMNTFHFSSFFQRGFYHCNKERNKTLSFLYLFLCLIHLINIFLFCFLKQVFSCVAWVSSSSPAVDQAGLGLTEICLCPPRPWIKGVCSHAWLLMHSIFYYFLAYCLAHHDSLLVVSNSWYFCPFVISFHSSTLLRANRI